MHDYLDEWEAKVYALSVAATHVCSKCVVDRELWRRVEADTTLGRCEAPQVLCRPYTGCGSRLRAA